LGVKYFGLLFNLKSAAFVLDMFITGFLKEAILSASCPSP
jgi:hypothetical protein